jgi:hypothetical protein
MTNLQENMMVFTTPTKPIAHRVEALAKLSLLESKENLTTLIAVSRLLTEIKHTLSSSKNTEAL